MNAKQILKAFDRAGKRVHLVGDLKAGVIAALDVEGRLFAVLDGEVLNRVNPEAITGQSTREHYFNPGGDGLFSTGRQAHSAPSHSGANPDPGVVR